MRRLSAFLSIVIMVLMFHPSKAQIMNIEKFRLDMDTSHYWLGNLGLSFSSTQQTYSVFKYSSYLNLAYLSKKHSYMTLNHIDFEQVNNTSIISDGYTHWRANFFRHHLVSPEPFIQFQYNHGKGLDYRQLIGCSLRMNVLKKSTDRNKLDLGIAVGAMNEQERWTGDIQMYATESDSTKSYSNLVKSTNYVYGKYRFKDKVVFFLTTYYQARFDRIFTQQRIVIDLQLNLSITKHLSFSSSYNAIFDNAPITPTNEYVHTIKSGLVIHLH